MLIICRNTNSMKDTLKSSEPTILAAVGVGTLVMLVALAYVLYARPSYLYMPLYDDFDDKNSDVVTGDHEETEMVEDREPS